MSSLLLLPLSLTPTSAPVWFCPALLPPLLLGLAESRSRRTRTPMRLLLLLRKRSAPTASQPRPPRRMRVTLRAMMSLLPPNRGSTLPSLSPPLPTPSWRAPSPRPSQRAAAEAARPRLQPVRLPVRVCPSRWSPLRWCRWLQVGLPLRLFKQKGKCAPLKVFMGI